MAPPPPTHDATSTTRWRYLHHPMAAPPPPHGAAFTVFQAAEDAAIALHIAVQARNAVAPAALARYEALRGSFKAMLGKRNPDLVKIGIEPDKTPPPATVEQKKARVARAQATRVARGTKGPKQKAAIKGQVPPAAPAPPPEAAPKTGQ